MKRWLLLLPVVAIVWFAVGYLSAGSACAHDPRFVCSPREARPVRIADPTKSWAFYGHLRAGEYDAFVFTVAAPSAIPWSLLVDRRDARNPGRPHAVLTRHGRIVARLAFAHPTSFYEPFSREHYLTTRPAMLHLAPGRYRITVTIPQAATTQRYVLAIGAQERFGIGEIPYVFGAIHRIRALRY